MYLKKVVRVKMVVWSNLFFICVLEEEFVLFFLCEFLCELVLIKELWLRIDIKCFMNEIESFVCWEKVCIKKNW